jgi:hypothetical protein
MEVKKNLIRVINKEFYQETKFYFTFLAKFKEQQKKAL